jgi:hypothetical protein
MRSCCKLGGAYTIGDEALVGVDPGIEFTERLLWMGIEAVIEDITVLAKDKVTEEVKGASAFDLMKACLSAGFGVIAMAVVVVRKPEIMNSYPHRSE